MISHKCTDQRDFLPRANMMAEAKESPMWPRVARSLMMAPTSRPLGPPVMQPMAYISRPMATMRPRTAAGMGKQRPEMRRRTKLAGAHSRKLQWARWALLNLYHCSQVSLAEYRPLPESGQPPLVISLSVAFLCSSPKFCFMKSSLKYSDRFPPAANPMKSSSTARTVAMMRTQPYSEGRLYSKVVERLPPQWRRSTCIKSKNIQIYGQYRLITALSEKFNITTILIITLSRQCAVTFTHPICNQSAQ